MAGTIYFAAQDNSLFLTLPPSQIKIGFTAGSPERRVAQLTSAARLATGNPHFRLRLIFYDSWNLRTGKSDTPTLAERLYFRRMSRVVLLPIRKPQAHRRICRTVTDWNTTRRSDCGVPVSGESCYR